MQPSKRDRPTAKRERKQTAIGIDSRFAALIMPTSTGPRIDMSSTCAILRLTVIANAFATNGMDPRMSTRQMSDWKPKPGVMRSRSRFATTTKVRRFATESAMKSAPSPASYHSDHDAGRVDQRVLSRS
jgi:hypothetical protein